MTQQEALTKDAEQFLQQNMPTWPQTLHDLALLMAAWGYRLLGEPSSEEQLICEGEMR